MSRTVTLIPGDSIGPEIAKEVTRIVESSGANIKWDWQESGEKTLATQGRAIPQELMDSVKQNKVALKGIINNVQHSTLEPPVITLRKSLDLYANLRPFKNISGIESRYDDIDIVVVRQNTQGEYSGIEHYVSPDIVEMMKVVTKDASEQIARFTFEYALEHNRKKITTVHKANIMKLSDGLFMDSANKIAEDYPDIEHNTLIIDACCMNLVMNPEKFDVLLMGNLYGDIVSDLITGMVGGNSAVYGVNIGDNIRIFEAMLGDSLGKESIKKANPLPLLMSAIAMLDHLEENTAADSIRKAISSCLNKGIKPIYLGGKSSLTDFADSIIKLL